MYLPYKSGSHHVNNIASPFKIECTCANNGEVPAINNATPDAITAIAPIAKVFIAPNLSNNIPPTKFPNNDAKANNEPVVAITDADNPNSPWKYAAYCTE